MSGVEVGTAYVTLLPSARGFRRAMERELGAADLTAGTRKTGKKIVEGVTEGVASEIPGAADAIGRRFATALQSRFQKAGESSGRAFSGGLTRALSSSNRAGVMLRDLAASSILLGDSIGNRLATSLRRSALPFQNFIAGFQDSRAATSAFTGRLGTLGGATASAGASLRSLGSSLSSLGGHISSVAGDISTRLAPALASIGAIVGKGALVGLAASVAGLVGLGAWGVSTSAQMQQTSMAFKSLIGDAGLADSTLRELTDFARTTPFDVPGVTDAGKKLLAYGFDAKELIPILTALGDAAAATGLGADGIQRITYALGQIKAKGRVQAQELLQLQETGIAATQMLADAMGVTQKEALKLVEKGLVPADFAVNALLDGFVNGTKNVKGFGGLMAEQAKTLGGVWSNLKDSVRLALNDGLAPYMDSIAQSVSNLIGPMTAFAEGFGAALGPALATLANDLGPALAQVGTALGPALGSLMTAIGPLISTAAPVIAQLATSLGAVLVPAAEALLPVFQQLAPALQTALAALGPYLGAIVVGLAPSLVQIAQGFGQIVSMMVPLIPPMTELVAVLLPMVTPLIGVAIGALQLFARAWGGTMGAAVSLIQVCAQAMGGLVQTVLNAGSIISGAMVRAFGWIPGVGDQLRAAEANFRNWAASARAETDRVTTGLAGVRNALFGLASGVTVPIDIVVTTTTEDGGNARARNRKARQDAKRNGPSKIKTPTFDIPKFTGGGGGGSGKKAAGAKSLTLAEKAGQALAQAVSNGFASGIATKSAGEIRSTVNNLIGNVQKAFSGSTEARLVASLTNQRNALVRLSSQLATTNKQLESAKKLRDQIAQTKYATKSNAIGGFTQLRSAPEIKNYLKERIGRVKSFAANLRTLSKRGLPKVLLADIVNAGLDGAALAEALAKSSSADFKAIANSAKALEVEASRLGDTAATGLYGMGLSAADGLIAGLEAKRKQIAKTMQSIAADMVKAIKKALGINSPAKALVPVGANTADGVIVGIDSRQAKVDAAMRGLVTVPRPARVEAPVVGSLDNQSPADIAEAVAAAMARVLDERLSKLGPVDVAVLANIGNKKLERR